MAILLVLSLLVQGNCVLIFSINNVPAERLVLPDCKISLLGQEPMERRDS